jgi:CheY-like chemotaxis protein
VRHDLHLLLVEDEAPKRGHIERLVRDVMPHARISTARSVNSALDILECERVGFLLLDMSLPTFDIGDRESGGRPQGFGGIEVLRHMTMAGIVCPTLIITGYEGFKTESGTTVDLARLRSELDDEFRPLLRGVLHYNSTYDEWKHALREALTNADLDDGCL